MTPEIIAVPPIDAWPIVVAFKQSPLLLTLTKALHLFGVAMLVGPVLAFDARILGWNRRIGVAQLARHLLPLALGAIVLLIPTGLALFLVESSELLSSRAFMSKMGLVLFGGIIAIAFHSGPYRTVVGLAPGAPAPMAAKLLASASVLGWLGVLFAAAVIGRP